MAIELIDNSEQQRYEVHVDGHLSGIADYRVDGDVVVLPHTLVDPSMRGQSLGAMLVERALDDARAAGRTVVPQCWYVAEFIAEHPEYADLVAVR
jgi:predicted GNAT family acetyltransferase